MLDYILNMAMGKMYDATRRANIKRTYRKSRAITKKVPKSVKRYVNKRIKQDKEVKYNLEPYNTIEVISTPTFDDISDIAEQTAANEDTKRSGDIVTPTSLRIRGTIHRKLSGTGHDNIRQMVIQWKPDTVTENLTALSQLLESSGTTSLDPFGHFKQDAVGKGKFKVLSDKVYCMSGGGTITNDSLVKTNYNVSLKNASKIRFTDAGTTGRNKIFLITYGIVATGANASERIQQVLLNFKG